MSDEQYRLRYVIGKYTPALPNHILMRRARQKAVRRGLCIWCRRNERDWRSHCQPCLDRQAASQKQR